MYRVSAHLGPGNVQLLNRNQPIVTGVIEEGRVGEVTL